MSGVRRPIRKTRFVFAGVLVFPERFWSSPSGFGLPAGLVFPERGLILRSTTTIDQPTLTLPQRRLRECPRETLRRLHRRRTLKYQSKLRKKIDVEIVRYMNLLYPLHGPVVGCYSCIRTTAATTASTDRLMSKQNRESSRNGLVSQNTSTHPTRTRPFLLDWFRSFSFLHSATLSRPLFSVHSSSSTPLRRHFYRTKTQLLCRNKTSRFRNNHHRDAHRNRRSQHETQQILRRRNGASTRPNKSSGEGTERRRSVLSLRTPSSAPRIRLPPAPRPRLPPAPLPQCPRSFAISGANPKYG